MQKVCLLGDAKIGYIKIQFLRFAGKRGWFVVKDETSGLKWDEITQSCQIDLKTLTNLQKLWF